MTFSMYLKLILVYNKEFFSPWLYLTIWFLKGFNDGFTVKIPSFL